MTLFESDQNLMKNEFTGLRLFLQAEGSDFTFETNGDFVLGKIKHCVHIHYAFGSITII